MSGGLRLLLAVVVGGGALLHAGGVRAFSDPFGFSISTIAAGGGGRYFTGSPSDGYTCKACHEGGESPKVEVLGLPLAGYKPGARYEVVIRWAEEFEKLSLALELTDAEGAAAGRIRLPPEAEIEDPEFCDPVEDQILAGVITETKAGRQIVGMPDCGAKRLRFLWTAPAQDVGPVWFSGSAVFSDGEGDPYHDGVTDFGRIIGTPTVASSTTAQCSVAHAGAYSASSSRSALACIAGVALCLSARRRRKASRLQS